MPEITSASDWRRSPYISNGLLWLDKAPIVFQAQVNLATITYPVISVPFDNVTFGSYTSIRRYSDIYFGSAPGLNDLGWSYNRLAAGGTQVFIGRSSQGTNRGTIGIYDDAYITVVDNFSAFSRLPFIGDGIFAIDGGVIPPVGQTFKDTAIDISAGTNGFPQINLGGGIGLLREVNPSTHLITLSFSPAALSKPYDSSAITSWLWDIRDGTITVGSPTTASITVTFPAGRRIISLTGTDTNSHPTTRYCLIVSSEDGGAFEAFKFFSIEPIDEKLGGNAQVRINIDSPVPISNFPDGGLVLVAESEDYNGISGPLNQISDVIGQTGFESQVFSGWHYQTDNDTVAGTNATLSNVTLTCYDPVGMMMVLAAYSQEMNRVTIPTDWTQAKNAAMDKYLWHLMFYHSTLLFLTDWYDLNRGDTLGFQRLGSDADTLFNQVNKLATTAVASYITGNQQGMIFARPDPILQDPALRTSTVIIDLIADDISEAKFITSPFPRTMWNRGAAIIASQSDVGTAPIGTTFSIAPGAAPGQGPTESDLVEQLVVDTNELVTREGNRYARENAAYQYLELTLAHPGNAGLDPAYGQWCTLTFTVDVPFQRPVTFNGQRAYVRGNNTTRTSTITGNVKVQKIIVELEIEGNHAVYDPPPVNPNPPPPTPAPPSPPPVGVQPGLQTGGTVWMWDDSLHFAFTYNFSSGSNWTSCVGTGLTGQIWEVKFDPYSPWWRNPSTSTPMYAWVSTTNGLFYGNCNSSSPVWSQKRSVSVPYGLPNQIRAASSLPGEVCWRYLTGGNTYVEWLNNYGSNIVWSGGPWYTNEWGLDIDQYGSRTAYLNASLSTVNIYRVVNGGTPQFMRAIPDPGNGTWLFIQKPLLTFGGAPNNQVGAGTTECLLVCSSSVPGAPQGMDITADGGNTWNTIDGSPHKYVDVLATSAIATDNSNIIAAHDGSYQIQTTINKGGLWTPKGAPPVYDSHGIIKFPGASTYAVCGCNMHNAFLSTDFGATIPFNGYGDWASSQGSGSLFGILPASNTSHG